MSNEIPTDRQTMHDRINQLLPLEASSECLEFVNKLGAELLGWRDRAKQAMTYSSHRDDCAILGPIDELIPRIFDPCTCGLEALRTVIERGGE